MNPEFITEDQRLHLVPGCCTSILPISSVAFIQFAIQMGSNMDYDCLQIHDHQLALEACCLQQDVEVPLSHLLNLIKERDGGGPLHHAESTGRDSSTLLYLAQKDVHSVLPHLALDPAQLPLKVSLSFFKYAWSCNCACLSVLSWKRSLCEKNEFFIDLSGP